jgi:cell volume regulation protein A
VGLLIALILIFVARPVAVYVSLLFSRTNKKEKLFLSWVGLRGAVPIVFATFPLIAGIEKAEIIFNLVFFISVTSVLLQGTSLVKVARWLKVIEPVIPEEPVYQIIDSVIDSPQKELLHIELPENCSLNNRAIVDIDFPRNAMIVLIERDNTYIVPNGSTTLQSGDKLIITAESKESLAEVNECLSTKIAG